MPKAEAISINDPPTNDMIDAVNNPRGTILFPAVLIGSVKTNAPNP